VIATTLKISLTSTTIASALSLPLGYLLAIRSFPGKRVLLVLLKTALALPTVVVGLFVYAFVARNAPLGAMNLLFTPAAIVIGQVILITPLVTALVYATLRGGPQDAHEEAIVLGASPLRAFWKTLSESRTGVTTALLVGFGRVVSEIGISLILGGNIRGLTRTITTGMALETGQGDFSRAVALGFVLLALVLSINLIVFAVGGRREAL